MQVRDGLLEFVAERGLQPGDQLPTEAEVGALFGVSRSTVREAMRLLERDGLIRTEHGRGRFLGPAATLRVERPIDRFESVTEMLTGLGYEPTSVVLSVEEAPATPAEREALELAHDARVIRLTRLRLGDERPLLYTVDTVPRDCLPGPLRHRDWAASLTDALAGHGHAVDSSVARIRAVELPADVSDRHGLAGLGPWLLIEETCVSRAGRKVLFALDYHRGSDIAFHVVRRRP